MRPIFIWHRHVVEQHDNSAMILKIMHFLLGPACIANGAMKPKK